MNLTDNQVASPSEAPKVRNSHYVSKLFVKQQHLLTNSLTETINHLLHMMSLTSCEKLLTRLKDKLFADPGEGFSYVISGFSQFTSGWCIEKRYADGSIETKTISSLSFNDRIHLLEEIEDVS